MFRNVLRSSSTTNAFVAGAAAAVTGSAFVASQQSEGMVSECADNTVVGLLQGIARKVSNIEALLGTIERKPPPVKRNGIDVVLGAQWGDEGKGKLVDMLSQVSCGTLSKLTTPFKFLYRCFSTYYSSFPTLNAFLL
jgi:adenylosuccinate synthase